MTFELQKANLWKRISAFLFDFILLVILAVGFAYLASLVTNYNSHLNKYEDKYNTYTEMYNVDINKDPNALTEEEKIRYTEFDEAVRGDSELLKEFSLVMNLTMVIVGMGLLFSVLILEFILPIIFKDGQTIGKKVFGICLVKNNAVKITTFQLFVRSILGKYTIELMIPVYLFLLTFFGSLGGTGFIVIILLFILQTCLFFITKNKTMIHDLFAYTVVVDKPSQRIFDTEDALIEFKKEQHLKEVEQQNNY